MDKYQAEAKKKWGNTSAYKQSVRRTRNWTKADYQRIEAEGICLTKQIAGCMDKGVDSPDVQKLIAQHYQGIRQFYDCPYAMYRNLGRMYVADPRFTAYYDKVKPGLAVFMREAMAYFSENQDADPLS
jgi:MerR family transcriptional regulator, thiopeptide resistance regulator